MTDHRTLSTQHKSLKATTVNINGLSKHYYEIVHQYMVTNSVQISCVTETKKQNTEVPDFPGYLTIPNNSSSNPGQSGVLLALDVNIEPSVFKLEIEIQHSTWAICNVSRNCICIVSPIEKYIARIPSKRIDRTLDNKIFQQTCYQIDN